MIQKVHKIVILNKYVYGLEHALTQEDLHANKVQNEIKIQRNNKYIAAPRDVYSHYNITLCNMHN